MLINRPATLLEGVLLLVVLIAGLAYWQRPRNDEDARSAVAHAVAHAARAETVLVREKAIAGAARVAYRTVRDSALHNLTDSGLVKRAFAAADTAFVHDTVTLLAADTVIGAQKAVIAALRVVPRGALVATVLYDPILGTPLVSLSASVRLLGPVRAVAVGFARPGAAPRALVGLSYSF